MGAIRVVLLVVAVGMIIAVEIAPIHDPIPARTVRQATRCPADDATLTRPLRRRLPRDPQPHVSRDTFILPFARTAV